MTGRKRASTIQSLSNDFPSISSSLESVYQLHVEFDRGTYQIGADAPLYPLIIITSWKDLERSFCHGDSRPYQEKTILGNCQTFYDALFFKPSKKAVSENEPVWQNCKIPRYMRLPVKVKNVRNPLSTTLLVLHTRQISRRIPSEI